MTFAASTEEDRSRMTPSQLAEALPNAPVLSSERYGWKNLVVQRFQFGSHLIDLPGMRDHVISLTLGGPVHLETKTALGGKECHWCEAGTINLNPAGHDIIRRATGRSDVLTIHIDPALVGEVLEEVFDRDPASLTINPRLALPDKRIHQFGPLLLAEAEDGAAGMRLMAEAFSRSLALHLIRHHSSGTPASASQDVAVPYGRMNRVVDHMRANLDADLSLFELAKVGGLSQSHLARAFRSATGQSPHRYLVALRIDRARCFLETTDLSVIEVGLSCGFESPNHFSTAFVKANGMSPRTWKLKRRW